MPKDPSELDFCTDALVNLAGHSRENLVKFLKAFPEKEPSTREALEKMVTCLELDYLPEQKVDDFMKTGIYMQQQGYPDAARGLFKAIIKKTMLRGDDYYRRIARLLPKSSFSPSEFF